MGYGGVISVVICIVHACTLGLGWWHLLCFVVDDRDFTVDGRLSLGNMIPL